MEYTLDQIVEDLLECGTWYYHEWWLLKQVMPILSTKGARSCYQYAQLQLGSWSHADVYLDQFAHVSLNYIRRLFVKGEWIQSQRVMKQLQRRLKDQGLMLESLQLQFLQGCYYIKQDQRDKGETLTTEVIQILLQTDQSMLANK